MMKRFLTIFIIFTILISCFGIFVKLTNGDNIIDKDSSNRQDGSLVEVLDFSELTYSAIGDSITYGFCGDHSKPPFYNNYPNVLKSLLGFRSVNNYGQCGYLLARHSNPSFKSMIDMVNTIENNSDIISVMGGINDYANYVELGSLDSDDEYEIYGALNKICSSLKSNFPNAYIFFMTPLPISNENILDINNVKYSINDVCLAIKLVCAKYDIDVLDINLIGGFDVELDSFDGCHPTELYYVNELAPQIAQFIKDNYKN